MIEYKLHPHHFAEMGRWHAEGLTEGHSTLRAPPSRFRCAPARQLWLRHACGSPKFSTWGG